MNKTDKILIIVESPNKVKTITTILKKAGYTKAVVIASVGHIIKLADGGPAYNSGIYPRKKFKMNLVVSEDKQKVVNTIIQQAQLAQRIYIGTDQDREGFLIGWSLIEFCKLPLEKCYRIVMHEITPKTVIHAIENPVPFNDDLVNAGLTRMMIDKLIGYGLSPLGKKYIGAKSIGRCQSVGLKLISDREKEINNFIPELYFNLYLNFSKNGICYKAKYIGYKEEKINKFSRQADVDAIIRDCKNNDFIIKDIITKIQIENSPTPFITATIQQEASNKLGLRVKDIMSICQKLFESGKITYHRSDSSNLSSEFVETAKQYIIDTFGQKYYIGKKQTANNVYAQEAHEAIRCTDIRLTPVLAKKEITNNLQLKVYTMIWNRTIQSLMPQAKYEVQTVVIANGDHLFSFDLKSLKEPGFKIVNNQQTDD